MNEDIELDVTALTADIVSAYVSHNTIQADKLPEFIASVHAALSKAAAAADGVEAPKVELIPAVPVKKSVTPDFIICLEDGKRFASMKRHLMTKYGMTPDEYRIKWCLPKDYPMTAPSYADKRSKLAHAMGLGQRKTADVTETNGATIN
jgi:predicted transcriptional regulator